MCTAESIHESNSSGFQSGCCKPHTHTHTHSYSEQQRSVTLKTHLYSPLPLGITVQGKLDGALQAQLLLNLVQMLLPRTEALNADYLAALVHLRGGKGEQKACQLYMTITEAKTTIP